MADIKIKFNPDADDVEIYVGDKKVDSVGSEVFQSWVTFYNKKHGYEKRVTEVDVTPEKTEETEEIKEEETNDKTEESTSKED